MESCLFCRIVQGEIPCEKIFENEEILLFLDIGPVSRGHTLIIPKEHSHDLASGSPHTSKSLFAALYEFAPRICGALGATGYNLGMNHGVDAGQEVFHTHLHLMPRYTGDSRAFVKLTPSSEELRAVADQIRAAL